MMNNYKSAAELGIEDWEREGLEALIEPMRSGKLNVNMAISINECGTIACIGGWLAFLHGFEFYRESDDEINCYVLKQKRIIYPGSTPQREPLYELFYPPERIMSNIPSSMAADAIECFLLTGSPQWDMVMDTFMIGRE